MITQKIIARTDSLKLDKIISRYGEDSMRQVVFIIVRPDPESEDLIPITIPEDAVGSFRILKPSGNFVIVPMSKSVLATGETAFDVVLPASANTAKGSGYYDIRITSDTDKYYFTAQGDFLIDDNILSDEALEDVSEVNGLIFPDDFLTVEDHVAYIDDETVSTDSTWSSDKISEEIEAHAGGDVSKTVSGNPVTFTDGANAPLVKCVTAIQGNQDLHGYDKPWVGGAGSNKWDEEWEVGAINGATGQPSEASTVIRSKNYCPISADATLYIKSPKDVYIYWYSSSSYGYISYTYVTKNTTITVPANTAYFKIQMTSAYGTTYNNDVAINYPSTVTTYSPYSNICPITAYTEGEIEVRGKNILNPNSAISYGSGSSTYSVSGNAINVITSGQYSGIVFDKELPNGTYSISFSFKFNNSGTASVAIMDKDNTTSLWTTGEFSSNTTRTGNFTVTHGIAHIRFYCTRSNASGNVTISNLMLNTGSSSENYEEFRGTTHTTTYPSAIYRGSEDVVNGEVEYEIAVADFANMTWTLSTLDRWVANDLQSVIKNPGNTAYTVSGTISEQYEQISADALYADATKIAFSIHTSGAILVRNGSTTTPPTGKIAYVLATKSTEQITPTNLPIKSLFGYNHIESTTGDMEIEYITEEYQPLIDSIKQL